MKIFTYPASLDQEELQMLADNLHKADPHERFILLREDIKYSDLSLRELYTLKKEIEDAIRAKEGEK